MVGAIKHCHVSALNWSQGPEVTANKCGGLTQNMMLNPKMKYLMQQLTSWALKCFPDIIFKMSFFLSQFFFLFVCFSRSSRLEIITSMVLLCLTAPVVETPFFFLFNFSTARQTRRQLFQRLIINILPRFRWQKGAEGAAEERRGVHGVSLQMSVYSRYGSPQRYGSETNPAEVNQIKADGLLSDP